MEVKINKQIIHDGEIIPFHLTQTNPEIKFHRMQNTYYTILMVDPDAPSPSNPIYKYWLHWLVINNSDTIAFYHYPSPPPGSGYHRYIFYVFAQKKWINPSDLDLKINGESNRKNFNLGSFIHSFELEMIYTTYFRTSR